MPPQGSQLCPTRPQMPGSLLHEEIQRNSETHFYQGSHWDLRTNTWIQDLYTWHFPFLKCSSRWTPIFLSASGLCSNIILSRSSSLATLTTFLKVAIHVHAHTHTHTHNSRALTLIFPVHYCSLTYYIFYHLTLSTGSSARCKCMSILSTIFFPVLRVMPGQE